MRALAIHIDGGDRGLLGLLCLLGGRRGAPPRAVSAAQAAWVVTSANNTEYATRLFNMIRSLELRGPAKFY